MTPRERVDIALRGGRPDRVPFTIYTGMGFRLEAVEEMQALGMCMVNRLGVFTTSRPNCTSESTEYEEDGRRLVRTDIHTPVGDLHSIREPANFTSWTHKQLFSDRNDYKALAFMLSDEVYEPCYDKVLAIQDSLDNATVLRASFGLEPLQQLISGGIFGTENFCLEWMENRDELLTLYDIIVENRRQVYPLVARSPVLHSNYGGNVVPEIVGPEPFRRYYLPHYQEAADEMHRHGKLIGVHFDGNCRLYRDDIAATDLDYIEAFTPSPDTDMTMAEARQAWRDKVIWINYPSSVHLQPVADVQRVTRELLAASEPLDGFLIGITEDVPPAHLDPNCRGILAAIEDYHAAAG